MKLNSACSRAGGEASLASGLTERCHWSKGCNNNVGGSLQERRATHNASNARGVTAGNMGRNASINNEITIENSFIIYRN